MIDEETAYATSMRRLDIGVVAACIACSVLVFVLFRDLRHDDAYITFQYARNIAEGDGFVFNANENILGTTTPLFTLVMALIYWMFGNVLPEAAIAISAAALAVQGVMVWILARDHAPMTGATLAILVVLGIGGTGALALETSLYAAFVIATIAATYRERETAAGVCLGLAFLTRYDAGLLVIVVVGWGLVRRRRIPMRSLLVSLAIVVPWLGFAQIYFGSVFPHTLGAKTSLTPMHLYLDRFVDLVLRPTFGLGKQWFGSTLVVAGLILGMRWMWKSCRAWIPLVVYAVAHVLAYAWIGPPVLQTWHTHLALLVVRLLVAAGVIGTIEELLRSAKTVRQRRIAWIAMAIVACSMVVTTARSLATTSRTLDSASVLGGRQRRYETVAGWLALHVRSGASLMATEVGTLGYLTRRRMIDPYGLITQTNDWPKTRSAASKRALIERTRPDVILFDSEQEAAEVGAPLGFRVLRVFVFGGNRSAIAVRDPGVLTPLGTFAWPADRLR